MNNIIQNKNYSTQELYNQKYQNKINDTTKIENQKVLENNSSAPNTDKYIHKDDPVYPGIYHLTKDENGSPKVIFDNFTQKNSDEDTKENSSSDNKKISKRSSENKKDDTVTGNTDKVDREIKNLKKKKAKLEQQISQSSDNPKKQEKLQRQLEKINSELKMKDNDSYRRQHTQYTKN